MSKAATDRHVKSGPSGLTLSRAWHGCGFLLQSAVDSMIMLARLIVIEPRIVASGVSRWCLLRPNQTPSQTKAQINKSLCGEIGTDKSNETCKSPKWLPRKSLPSQRARSGSCIPPASRSKCHTTKEAMPVSTGRTDSRSPANVVAQAPSAYRCLAEAKEAI